MSRLAVGEAVGLAVGEAVGSGVALAVGISCWACGGGGSRAGCGNSCGGGSRAKLMGYTETGTVAAWGKLLAEESG